MWGRESFQSSVQDTRHLVGKKNKFPLHFNVSEFLEYKYDVLKAGAIIKMQCRTPFTYQDFHVKQIFH